MKKILVLACVLLALSSCQKSDEDSLGLEKVSVTFDLSGLVKTKDAVQTADEAKVNNIQIFVFNGDSRDGYKEATSSEISVLSVTVEANPGTRDIWAFVNAPDLGAYTSKAELLSAVSNLSDNASDSFVMSGSLTNQTIASGYSATIYVDRYAARVRLLKVTRQFASTALQTAKFRINKVYLTSVISSIKYNREAVSSQVYINQSFGSGSRAMQTGNSFVYQKLSTPAEVTDGSSHVATYAFYGYPNPLAVQSEPYTDGKDTRLVVETQIDVDGDGLYGTDEYYTYAVPLGAISANKTYEVSELIITRLGNDSDGDDDADDGEDDIINTIESEFAVDVNDWTVILVGDAGVVTI